MNELRAIVDANRAGAGQGICSVCSAHPMVLEACIDHALENGGPLLVEATCNQVNQEGGYTGMQPAQFRDFVLGLAAARGLPTGRLILGGDHLGPNPWRQEPAEAALAKAQTMVRAYAEAGFTKIHLDASMACAGDPEPLPAEVIARRAARLAQAAEAAGARPAYVVGTEVPVPGGAHEVIDHLEVTHTEDLTRTIEVHRSAFAAAGLDESWSRVLAVVVQPGVEFGSVQVVDFVPERADALAAAIRAVPGLAFEAHSTDYQTEPALAALVERHFAILKVGPGLTFALREALFALALIEAELVPPEQRSRLREALEASMLADPRHWQGHYPGAPDEQRLARAFSLSDRCRYYWPVPAVAAAVERLLANLARQPVPLPLLSQYLPRQHEAVRAGHLKPEPRALVRAKIAEV
ncbi:MAG: D-tagatose-bisphosphate aldolase, class II, non-catalytic subunit, partial [Geminicoccaceae bacterium]